MPLESLPLYGPNGFSYVLETDRKDLYLSVRERKEGETRLNILFIFDPRASGRIKGVEYYELCDEGLFKVREYIQWKGQIATAFNIISNTDLNLEKVIKLLHDGHNIMRNAWNVLNLKDRYQRTKKEEYFLRLLEKPSSYNSQEYIRLDIKVKTP